MEEKQHWAIARMQQWFEKTGRLPKKEDFDEATRSRIKAFLGPWPRALEAAGLKTAKRKPSSKKKRRKTTGLPLQAE